MDFLEDPTLRERAMSVASILTNTMEGTDVVMARDSATKGFTFLNLGSG